MSPAMTVREALKGARRAGVDFGTAWWAVLQAVEDERWREALGQTSSTWRRAYMCEPATEGDRAIDMLSRGIAGDPADLDDRGRCVVCDARLAPVLRGRKRVYCSTRCLKVAAARPELLDAAA